MEWKMLTAMQCTGRRKMRRDTCTARGKQAQITTAERTRARTPPRSDERHGGTKACNVEEPTETAVRCKQVKIINQKQTKE